jgi:hypothetical protein
MISTEERLRAATRAAADTVTPGSAPPLRLPADPGRRPGRLGRLAGDRRRWLRAMTPLAAAAAVAAVVIVSLTLTSGMHGPPRGEHPSAGTAALGGLPPYYLALAGVPGMPERAVIRATTTGKALATVTAPRPYSGFTFVTGADDDRTFILATQRWWRIAPGARGLAAEKRNGATPAAFFRLRFDPATRSARLMPLHVPQKIPAGSLSGIGVSPDGTRLAMTLHPAEIEVVTLATGSARHWVWPGSAHSTRVWAGNDKPDGQPLSWTADGRTLAFRMNTQSGGITDVRLLDTTSPGNSLRAARPSVTFLGLGHFKRGPIGNVLITPDGTRIVTVTQRSLAARAQVTEFSARTGQAVASPGRGRAAVGLSSSDVLWTSSSGTAVIVEGAAANPARAVTAVVRGGRFTPLPGFPAGISNVAW